MKLAKKTTARQKKRKPKRTERGHVRLIAWKSSGRRKGPPEGEAEELALM